MIVNESEKEALAKKRSFHNCMKKTEERTKKKAHAPKEDVLFQYVRHSTSMRVYF